jgi:hypothetical protein
MIEKIHEHIIEELKTNTKTDTIFILTAILLNFIGLGISAITAMNQDTLAYTIFGIITVLIIIVNMITITGLQKGKKTRHQLLSGLLKMYEDQNVSGYYDAEILKSYDTRYSLFTLAVITTGAIAIIIPIVVFILG